MEKDQFISEIINSATGIAKVHPKEDMWSEIEQKIIQKNSVSRKTIWLVAASIVILFTVNILLLSHTNVEKKSDVAALEQVMNKDNQLYK